MGNCCTRKQTKPTVPELTKKYNITDKKMKEYRESFKNFDINGDGKITAEELLEVMKLFGYKSVTPKMAQQMVMSVDVDGSGAIEFDEFVLLMSRTPPATENIDREQSSLLFSVFDKNRDGFISKEEVRKTMDTMEITLTDQQLNEMMKEVDKNNDGKIDKSEFRALYGKLIKGPLAPKKVAAVC